MEIPEDEHNFEIYFKLIKQAADLKQCDSKEKLAELAEGVLRELVVGRKQLFESRANMRPKYC